RSDTRLAGRLFWRMKYLSPFGSVAVRTAVSKGSVSWRLIAGCPARTAVAIERTIDAVRARAGRVCICDPDQLSTLNAQLSTLKSQLSTLNPQRSTLSLEP